MVCLRNELAFTPLMLGCMWSGTILAPINPFFNLGLYIKVFSVDNKSDSLVDKNLTVNLTVDSSRVFTLFIMQFADFLQQVRVLRYVLSVITTKNSMLTYFRVPLDIKHQYLKLKETIKECVFCFNYKFLIYLLRDYNFESFALPVNQL